MWLPPERSGLWGGRPGCSVAAVMLALGSLGCGHLWCSWLRQSGMPATYRTVEGGGAFLGLPWGSGRPAGTSKCVLAVQGKPHLC